MLWSRKMERDTPVTAYPVYSTRAMWFVVEGDANGDGGDVRDVRELGQLNPRAMMKVPSHLRSRSVVIPDGGTEQRTRQTQ
jgi:hypothetical protein